MSSKASIIRIISFTLAGADVIQTIPGTYKLYKKQWTQKSISAVAFFYAATRYLSIISLISNGIGFYGTHFTLETCRPWYMLPNITAMLAGMAVQALVFIRTWAISKRAPLVFYGLGGLLVLLLPVQAFGIIYHRKPYVVNGNCKGRVPGIDDKSEPDWNIVYYIAHLVFDLVACTVATVCIIMTSNFTGVFNASKFIRQILRNGVMYAVVVSVANLLVVLEFTDATTTGIGAVLPLAIILIAAQHLILSTQRPTSDDPSTDLTSRSRSRSHGPTIGGGIFGTGRRSLRGNNTDVEGSGVFVLTETYIQGRDTGEDDLTRKDNSAFNSDGKGEAYEASVIAHVPGGQTSPGSGKSELSFAHAK